MSEAVTLRPGRGARGAHPGTLPTESQLGRVARTAGEAADATAQLTTLTSALSDLLSALQREMKTGNGLMKEFIGESKKLRRTTIIAAWQTRKHNRNQVALMHTIERWMESK